MASKEHTLMASGAPYVLRVTKDGSIKALPATYELTPSGYRKTGGDGRALCSCGWTSPERSSREARRAEWERHFEEENPWYAGDKVLMRNAEIKALAEDRIDEINSDEELHETPVFMTRVEKNLYTALTPQVIIDLVTRYRKQR